MPVGNFGTNFSTTTGGAKGSRMGSQKHCAAQSLIKALDHFMNTMDQMSDVVMVPNRLKGIILNLRDTFSQDDPKDIEVPKPTSSLGKSLVPIQHSADSSPDLFSFYRMLQTVQQELVYGAEEPPKRRLSSVSSAGSSGRSSGSESPLDSDLEDGSGSGIRDARAHQLATNFKIHLRGLFEVMHQLTDTAQYLSDRYQEDVTSPRKD